MSDICNVFALFFLYPCITAAHCPHNLNCIQRNCDLYSLRRPICIDTDVTHTYTLVSVVYLDGIHAVSILCMLHQFCTLDVFTLYSRRIHAVFMLYSCCICTVLTPYSCCIHAVFTPYSRCIHAVLTLPSAVPVCRCRGVHDGDHRHVPVAATERPSRDLHRRRLCRVVSHRALDGHKRTYSNV